MNYYVHRALFKIGFFKKVNVTTSVTINGRLFRVPVVREAGYHNLMRRDVWLFEVLERLLAARPGAVVDVGMNIGQT
ncbi:MAG TPA: hypothetical protein VMJ10_01145, partial [Kofleriaceae bacterium]|nr:hypothetical protein [Kofleriaceae bacterium]